MWDFRKKCRLSDVVWGDRQTRRNGEPECDQTEKGERKRGDTLRNANTRQNSGTFRIYTLNSRFPRCATFPQKTHRRKPEATNVRMMKQLDNKKQNVTKLRQKKSWSDRDNNNGSVRRM